MKVKVSKVRKKNTENSLSQVTMLYHTACSSEDEHFPYKNLRHTIGCCIESRYGEYTDETKKQFENDLALSYGCLDSLSDRFLISLKDLVAICDSCLHSYVPSEVLFCWIRQYVKEYVLC